MIATIILTHGLPIAAGLAVYFWLALPRSKSTPAKPLEREVYETEFLQLGGG